MKRRNFLKGMLYSSAAISPVSGLILPGQNAFAATYGNTTQRTLINTMLLGGADLRYLFVPQPGTAYAEKFWLARSQLYRVTENDKLKYPDYAAVWQDLYLPTLASDGSTFGIHKSASWLKYLYDANSVAIIANVVASTNRRHDHSQLIMHTGDLLTNPYIVDRDGWGGRLVTILAGTSNMNVVAMSHDVGIYCNSTNPGNRLDHAIHMRDSRNFSLPGPDNNAPIAPQSVMARALKAYYAKRGEDIEQKILDNQLPEDWPFRRFFQHESGIRHFGDIFDARLQDVMPIQPELLSRLYQDNSSFKLNNSSYGKQIANLYDSLLGADLLNLRSAYMEIGNWDTHRSEKDAIENNLHDVFGTNGGLDSLGQELSKTPGMVENMVLTFTTDFGRQLAANGTNGSDHGTGNYMIVLGMAVNGGTYGEMFPQREITPDAEGKIPYELQGADIKGLTSFERVLSEVCDWVQPGSGAKVFPNMANIYPGTVQSGPILEPGVDLRTLFKPGYYLSGKITTINTEAYNFQNMTVTVRGSTDFTVTVPVDANGIYRVGPLSDGSYTVTPSKDRFVFDPQQSRFNIAGGNIDYADFTATPLLQFVYAVKHTSLYTAEDGKQYRIMQAIGYNFVPNETQVTIGSIPVIVIAADTYLFTLSPPELTSGEIVVSTPTESYTHPVRYEDLQFV